MQYLGMLLVAVMLFAGPAEAKEPAKKKKAAKPPAAAVAAPAPPAKSLCIDLRPENGIYRLLPHDAEIARLLLVQPPMAAGARPEAPPPIRLDTDEEQVALAFPNSSAFTPWLGAAALNEELAGEQLSYRLSAGLGCELDRSTRLSFGYHYATEKPEIGDPLGRPPASAEEEKGHRFSFGLKKSF